VLRGRKLYGHGHRFVRLKRCLTLPRRYPEKLASGWRRDGKREWTVASVLDSEGLGFGYRTARELEFAEGQMSRRDRKYAPGRPATDAGAVVHLGIRAGNKHKQNRGADQE
jgi:hypothetical protein